MIEIKDLIPIGIIFVILGVALTIGANIGENLEEDTCDYTWIARGTTKPTNNSEGNNPITGAYYGCCRTTLDLGTNCTQWETGDHALNATHNSLEAIGELGDWQDTIALVLVAAVIIGVLVGALYVKFGKGGV